MYTNTDIAIGGLIQATSEYKYAMKVYVNFEETRAKVKELVESNKMLLSGDAFKTLEKGEKPAVERVHVAALTLARANDEMLRVRAGYAKDIAEFKSRKVK